MVLWALTLNIHFESSSSSYFNISFVRCHTCARPFVYLFCGCLPVSPALPDSRVVGNIIILSSCPHSKLSPRLKKSLAGVAVIEPVIRELLSVCLRIRYGWKTVVEWICLQFCWRCETVSKVSPDHVDTDQIQVPSVVPLLTFVLN